MDAAPRGREPRTILLSATVTEHDLAVLRKLFEPAGGGAWLEALELAVRGEADIWVAMSASADEQDVVSWRPWRTSLARP